MRWLIVLVCLAVSFGSALAQDPADALDDPQAEARASHISEQLRCVVCQNQSIEESNAALARDLRLLVRERVAAGDTDEEVLDYVVARYGEFVLLKPRFEGEGIVLWIAPLLLFLIGGGLVLWYLRSLRSAPEAPQALSEEEQAALKQVLEADEGDEPRPSRREDKS